jgi:hypothetical protein
MMDDLFQRFDSGDADIARHLAVFADIELSPSVAGTTAMRMTVMNAAHRRAALLEADRTLEAQATWAARKPSPPIELPRRSFWETWRRPMAAILAGCMTLTILAGTAWSARPGGPLYAARLWTEMANLPGDLLDRADAEVRRLEARIDEARQASSSGDGPGTEAALTAYTRIATEAVRNTAGNAAATAAIGQSVEGNVTVLTDIADNAPSPTSRAAAQDALMQSDRILEGMGGSRPNE